MAEQEHDEGLGDVLGKLAELGEKQDTVAVSDIQEGLGQRSFGPFLLVPAVIEVSPIGGIPGLPTVLAAIVILFAVQLLFGKKHLWLPGFVAKRSVKGEKLKKAADKVRPVAKWTDKVVRPRLTWAAKEPWIHIVAALSIGLACTVPPLEIIPFASTAPMGVIGLFGLALIARDGLLLLIGCALSLAAFYVAYISLI